MLKRKGQVTDFLMPGSTVRLTPGQLNAYTAAFTFIQPEFDEMRQMQQQVDRFPQTTLEQLAGSSGMTATITAEGIEWETQTQLLILPKCEIYLCRKSSGKEFAIIQRFQEDAPYAKTNGNSEILQTGNDARQLVSDYTGEAQHTLRFMASNLVAKTQCVAFERFPEHNPGKVVRAISERCLLVVSESLGVTESVCQTTHQVRGIRI